MVEDEALRKATPFAYFERAHEFVMRHLQQCRPDRQDSPKWTALHFLDFMKELNTIFLQDAAAMLVLHPERENHPLFCLDCFKMGHFKVSTMTMLLLYYYCGVANFAFFTGIGGADATRVARPI